MNYCFRTALTGSLRSSAQISSLRQFSATASSTIRDRLKSDLKTAMKTKDALSAKVIRTVMADVTYAEKANPDRFNDSMILPLIQKAVTQRNEMKVVYTDAGRKDLADKELEEKAILEKYLPTQLTDAEIDTHLQEILASLAGQRPQVGAVMKAFYERVERASVKGDAVASRVKSLLTPA